jgi:hypothetical protein
MFGENAMTRLLLPVLLLGGCHAQRTEIPPAAQKSLHELRIVLDALRPTTNFPAQPTADITVLVGLTRSQIRASLGKPYVCDYPKLAPNEVMVAPCEHNGDWVYSFYRLPPTYFGGGPELLLSFGSDDVCTAAKWVWTQ